MGYSLSRPMFWLKDHDHYKKGEPIGNLALIAVARVKMLCANGIVGTEDDLKSTECEDVVVEKVEVVDKEDVVEINSKKDFKKKVK